MPAAARHVPRAAPLLQRRGADLQLAALRAVGGGLLVGAGGAVCSVRAAVCAAALLFLRGPQHARACAAADGGRGGGAVQGRVGGVEPAAGLVFLCGLHAHLPAPRVLWLAVWLLLLRLRARGDLLWPGRGGPVDDAVHLQQGAGAGRHNFPGDPEEGRHLSALVPPLHGAAVLCVVWKGGGGGAPGRLAPRCPLVHPPPYPTPSHPTPTQAGTRTPRAPPRASTLSP
jgi:hypothetical protein